MKLRLLTEGYEGDLVDDPNWIMRAGMPFSIPVNYQQAKEHFKEEMRLLNFNDDSEIFRAIKDSKLWAHIDLNDYPQYFQKQAEDFHVDDEFSMRQSTGRDVSVDGSGLHIEYRTSPPQNFKESENIPPDVVAKLQKIYTDNKTILLQAFDSYLRDNGRSIREFGMRIPYYGM